MCFTLTFFLKRPQTSNLCIKDPCSFPFVLLTFESRHKVFPLMKKYALEWYFIDTKFSIFRRHGIGLRERSNFLRCFWNVFLSRCRCILRTANAKFKIILFRNIALSLNVVLCGLHEDANLYGRLYVIENSANSKFRI